MKNFLTVDQIKALKTRHRHERDKRVCDRIKAILMRDRGHTLEEIALALLLDIETIRRYISDYCTFQKIEPMNGGSESHLSDEQAQKLQAHLREKTYLYVKEICAYVKSVFNVRYSVSGMTAWLKKTGFRYKKPQPVPGRVDVTQQSAFIDTYHELKAGLPEGERIYFVDSVHPQHQTKLAFGWIYKGLRKFIPTTARQYRLNVMGGICLDGHKLITAMSEKIDAESIKNFLKKVRKHNPSGQRVHLILDNAGYHRSKVVQAFAVGLNIKLHYLPPYSPNLNPIERLWKILHEQVTCNRYYKTFVEFTDSVVRFFRHIGKKKKLLRSRITDNFQIFPPSNFAV